MKKIFLFSLIILTNFYCFAEVESIHDLRPAASPNLSPKQKRMYSLLLLELDMADASFETFKNNSGKSKLVLTYERIAAIQCMSKLSKTLVYNSPPDTKECHYYLDKLLKIHPNNPVGICIRDGIDATTCKTSYEEQLLGILNLKKNVKVNEIEAADLDAKLASYENKEEIKNLNKKLKKELKVFKKENTWKNLEHVIDSYNKIIPVACSTINLKILEKRPKDAKNLKEHKYNKKSTGSLKDLIDEFDKNSSTKTTNLNSSPIEKKTSKDFGKEITEKIKNQEPLWRVRYLTKNCWKYINEAIKHYPKMIAPNCYKEGFYSPACINAKRYEKNRRAKINSSKSSKKSKKNNQGMVTF